MPLLQLLLTYQRISPSVSKTQKNIDSLEMLLAKYIILPARASFLITKRPKTNLDAAPNQSLYNDLLAALCESALYEPQRTSLSTTLYSIAIRSIPRETPKQRTAENPWLQSLFGQLIESAPSMPSSPPNSLESVARFVRSMLHEAVEHNVLLDITLLETLLCKFSGVISNDGGLDIVDLDLVSLCLELNPDVFVLRSPQRVSNMLLTSLLARITEASFEPAMNHRHEHETVLSNVILPLVQAFAHARDLLRFVDHWKEELTRHEEKVEDPDAKPSIWEDDRLSQTVADLIKSGLTTGQVKQVLLAAHADLPLLAPGQSRRALASLVILDCTINGCTSHENIVELTEIASSIYTSLLEVVSDDKYSHMPKMWRVWRTLATINKRWPIPHAAPDIESAEHLAMRRALKLVDCDASRSNFAEELHAFDYILSFAAPDTSGSEVLPQSLRRTVRRAFDIVLNHAERLCDLVRSEEGVAPRHLGSAPQWNGRNNAVDSAEIFIMGCLAQWLLAPEILQ